MRKNFKAEAEKLWRGSKVLDGRKRGENKKMGVLKLVRMGKNSKRRKIKLTNYPKTAVKKLAM